MIKMTLKELAQLLQTETNQPDTVFQGLSKDNRQVQKGNLFVALLGENFDSHEFVDAAFQNGATAALVNRRVESSIPQIIVPDTILALGKLSQHWRNQFSLPLVGITGSNGKTTLKNMVANILLKAVNDDPNAMLATEGNLNNTIGLPFTLAKLNKQHRLGVIEMGMNIPGEISYLTHLTRPQIAVITNAAESHLAGVKDVRGVAKEKGEIFLGLQPNGVAVLNRDDQFYDYWLQQTKIFKRITFGLHADADVRVNIVNQTATQQHLVIYTPVGEMELNLPLLGEHNALNALAATACGLALDLDLGVIKNGLETMRAAEGRMNPYVLSNGVRIIDDSYNANPFSAHAAIKTLAQFPGTKIFVLADMRELGPDEIALHTLTGERAKAAGINYVFTFGELSKATSKAFGENGQHFTNKETLIAALKPFLQKDTTILVKGSHSMKMEQVVEKLKSEVETKNATPSTQV